MLMPGQPIKLCTFNKRVVEQWTEILQTPIIHVLKQIVDDPISSIETLLVNDCSCSITYYKLIKLVVEIF